MDISKLSQDSQAGFAAQEAATGELIDTMTDRLLEEIGITYLGNAKRRKVAAIISKVEVNPDAFKDVVDDKAEEIALAAAAIAEGPN